MKKRIFWLVAIAAFAAGVSLWWLGASGESSRSRKAASARSPGDLGSEASEDRARSSALRSTQSSRGTAQRRAAFGAVGGVPSTAPSAAELAAEPAAAPQNTRSSDDEEAASTEEVLANLDATFEMETPDRSWGARTVSDIYEVVRPVLGKNSEVRSVECRTSLCRVESVQEDMDHYASFVTKLKRSKLSPEGFYTQTGATPDGRPIVTLYLARQGYPMPRLE